MKKYDLRQNRFYRRSNCLCFGERAVLFKRSTETSVLGFQTNACFGYSNIYIFSFFYKGRDHMQRCFTALSSLLVRVSQLCFIAFIDSRYTSINSGFFKDWYKRWSEAWEAGDAVKWWIIHQRRRFSPWRTLEHLCQGKLREEKALSLFYTADIVMNQMLIGEMFL